MKYLRFLMLPLLFTGLALVVFRAVWPAERILQSTDFNIGVISIYKRIFPADWFSGSWTSTGMLGVAASRPFNLTNLLIVMMPVEVFCDWGYALHLVIASAAFAGFLRLRGVSLPASLLGTLAAFWLGSNLTLIFPGHLYKYGVLTGAALFLYFWERALAAGRPQWFVLAGGAFGLMFLEQQDLAVFCAVLLGPYAIWRLLGAPAATAGVWRHKAVFAAVPALLLMSDAYFKAKATFIDPVAGTRTAQENWDWATQWSWPPGETIDFIAPGYFGLRSGEPSGEYRGEMGRSPEWAKTGQGFRNFKLESQYLGMIPVGLALLAMVLAFAPFSRGADRRGDLRFWAVATLLLFVLSCGKYLPLYRLFYELPMMASIRNPNKFLQVFQLALGVLTAFGADALLGSARATLDDAFRRRARWMVGAVGGVTVVLLLAWVVRTSSIGELALKIGAQGFANAPKMAERAAAAIGHATAMGAVLAGVFWLALMSPWSAGVRFRAWVARGLVAVVMLDAALLSGDYLVAQDLRVVRNNPVAAYLKKAAAGSRVHALDQSGLNNHLLTYVFPYEGVDAMNLMAAPRVRSDLAEYQNAIGRNIFRQWNHFGVSHVLVSAEQWASIRQSPQLASALEPVLGWGAVADAKSDFRFVEVPLDRNPPNLVLRYKNAPGRYRLVGAWREAAPAEVLRALANPAEETDARVWVESLPGSVLPPSGEPGPAGVVQADRGINNVGLAVSAGRPALLVLSDHFNPAIRATVNGQPTPIRRVNHLLIGVPVPSGKSEVRLVFVPPRAGIRAVQAGLALCFAAAFSLLKPPMRARREEQP
jgi:hypothetical protein